MSRFLYDLFLKLYRLGIGLSARQGNKAEKWIRGREHIFEEIGTALQNKNEKRIWIHCASLGEFEQGRPVIEAIQRSKQKGQDLKIVLTFFSPSGYEIRKDYEHADYVFYLPLDGKEHAEEFVQLVDPSLAIFVKYEFWYYYLSTLRRKNIPVFLVSAKFRASQPFFKWYGSLFRRMISCYTHLFVQDQESRKLLATIGITENVTVAGDTRYDRVASIAKQARVFPDIDTWRGADKIMVAGSTWPDDEKILHEAIHSLSKDWKLIIAPHEIHKEHLQSIIKLFDNDVMLYSQLPETPANARILLIDNIGMLSSLYRYGDIAFIGGGFGSGIHNILEAAIFGIPVIFGPNYKRFTEATQMLQERLAFSVKDNAELHAVLQELTANAEKRTRLKEGITAYMKRHLGATDIIIEKLNEQIR